MRLTGNTILITGGATGIGLALAERLIALDNKVIVCGRREEKLGEAKKRLPEIHVRKCDISKAEDRKSLHNWLNENFKELNVLINNAGIQRPIDFRKGAEDLLKNEDEIDTNLKAQIHLAAMFVPQFSKQNEAAIVNVSSGLGFVPLTRFPVYSATKAAIHSFTVSLRHQLKETPIKVFEVIPPTVHDTELKGKPIEKTDYSVSAVEVADAVIKALEKNEYEIPIGPSKRLVESSKSSNFDQAFQNMNH